MGSANVKAIVSPIIKKGTLSPARVNAPSSIRSPAGGQLFGNQLANSLAGDLESLADNVNSLHASMQSSPTISQIQLTNAAGEITAAFGPVVYKGVPYTNYLSEIHVGNPLMTNDPSKALFNANLDGSVTIGQNGWLDVLDPYGKDAAWIGTQFETLPVTGAANNGAGLIRLTVPGHNFVTGNTAKALQVGGVDNATGIWTLTVIDASHVDLQSSVWSGAYTSGGIIDRRLQITAAASNGAGFVRVTTAIAHGYESGTSVDVAGGTASSIGQWIISVPVTLPVTGAANNGAGLIRLTVPGHNFTTGDFIHPFDVGGVPNANEYYSLTVVDASHIDLNNSVWSGTYTFGGTVPFLHANFFDLIGSTFAGPFIAGGTLLQYFAGMLAQTIAIGASFQNYKLRAFPSGDLRINNATIQLTAANGKIILDPTVPSLTLYDGAGTPTVTLESQSEAAIGIAAATNATPVVITMSAAHTYVNGDTIFIQGATGNTAINGYRIVESLSAPSGTFKITDLGGHDIHGNGTYAGPGTATRYYAGILAQTLALGGSFAAYRMRFFADGTLKINNASIDQSAISNATITTSTLQGSFTSTAGTGPDVLTLAIANGILTISGTGTQAGLGTITIDGAMTAGSYSVGTTAGADGPVVISGLTLNFSKGIYTGKSGAFGTSGFSGTATVRNAAGTGTSALTFVNGICTAYTP